MIRALVIGLAVITCTAAQSQNLETDTMRDWTVVRGTSGQGCFATMSVGLKAPSSGLATVSLFKRAADDGAPAVMTIQVPLGASLPDGIAYTHSSSGEAIGLAWQYCTPETCVASGGVSEAELNKLRAGRRVFLGFVPLPGSAPLITPVSLLGITRAWNAVQDCS